MCHLMTDIWSDILNSYMARGWSVFLWIFQNITTSKQGPPPFFHLDTNLVLGNVLVYPVEENHVLVVTVELIWLLFLNILFLNFVQTPNKSLRFGKFRRSNVQRFAVVQTNHCQSCTAFFAWCALSKVSIFLFFEAVSPLRYCICVAYFFFEHTCCSNVVSFKVGKQTKPYEIIIYNSWR